MEEYPVFSLDAVCHKDRALASRVFSISEVDYYLYVKIPPRIARAYELYQVHEIREKEEFVCHRDLWIHEPGRIWYKFRFHMLNKDVGLHVYRLGMVNTCTGDTMHLFFSYTIQNSDPDKPYVYMNSEEGGVCGCGSSDSSSVQTVQC